MRCNRSYPVCITRQAETVVGSQLMPNQLVRADTSVRLPGLGRHGKSASARLYSPSKHCSGDASRPPNGPAAGARGSGREARPKPAAAPDSRCTTAGCSAPAGDPRGHSVS